MLELVGDPLAPRLGLHEAVHHADGAAQVVLVGIAQIDRHRHASWDGVGNVRRDVEPPHRGHHVAPDVSRDLAHPADDLRRGHQGVVPHPHGGRAGVVLHTVEREPGPGNGDDALHDSHWHLLLLEDGPLLDVQLQIGAHGAGDAGLGPDVADTLQLLAEPLAVAVPRVVGVLQRDLAGHDPGAHHGGLEAGPFLVGEDDHADRMARASALVVERADRLERAENAQLAVVLAAGGDGIRMRAHEDGRERLRARAETEDVAHLVHADLEPRAAHPAHEEVAPVPVLIGQRQASEAAPGSLADAAEGLHALFESLPVDPHRALLRRRREAV